MIKILDLNFRGHNDTIASFLIETSAGPVLVETGPYSTFEQLKSQLAKHNYLPEDIQHVLITHIHLDHAGAAWAFAKNGTTIYLHPVGIPHMVDPSRLMDSARRIYKDQMDSLWGEMNPIEMSQLKAMQHGEAIIIGDTEIKAWYTPGHAIHHIAWQVGDELFTGDVGGVSILGAIVVPPCPPPDINLEDWKVSIDLIRGLNLKALYLTHYGKVTDIDNHLNKLEHVLWDWANWIKPYYEAGKHHTEVTPLFQTYVQQQLTSAGIEGEGLVQYENANPSWMSVVGLMRYWRKRAEAGS